MGLLGKDLNLYVHVLLGLATILLSFYILTKLNVKKVDPLVKKLSIATAVVAWLQILPSAVTYLVYYPATKTLVKAGNWPWAHSILMETKEHWGMLLPVIVTVAAGLVVNGKPQESKKWWWLAVALAIIIAVMGRVVKIGALK